MPLSLAPWRGVIGRRSPAKTDEEIGMVGARDEIAWCRSPTQSPPVAIGVGGAVHFNHPQRASEIGGIGLRVMAERIHPPSHPHGGRKVGARACSPSQAIRDVLGRPTEEIASAAHRSPAGRGSPLRPAVLNSRWLRPRRPTSYRGNCRPGSPSAENLCGRQVMAAKIGRAPRPLAFRTGLVVVGDRSRSRTKSGGTVVTIHLLFRCKRPKVQWTPSCTPPVIARGREV